MINNQGGGIFRILPGEKDTPAYDTYFETVQKRSVKQLCKAFGLGYRSASSTLGLKWQLSGFFAPQTAPKSWKLKPSKIK